MTIFGFEQLFSTMRYPAGETHVEAKLNTLQNGDVIQVNKCRGFEDLGNILTAAEILKNIGIRDVTWFIPYFPFGRHDRRRHQTDGLELKIALEMVSHLRVVTLDPHSDVLGQLPHIPQSVVVELISDRFNLFEKNPIVIIPDLGATKKAYTWIKKGLVIQAKKCRNPRTGELSGFELDVEQNLNGCSCLIVDDICDGGGTFIGLADMLNKYGASDLTLVVTHGLFTKGTDELKKRFNKIYSTGPYSFFRDSVERLPLHLIYEKGRII